MKLKRNQSVMILLVVLATLLITVSTANPISLNKRQGPGGEPKTPPAPSDGKAPETPPSDGKAPETLPSDGKAPDTPPSDGKAPDTPPSDGKAPDTPPSDGKAPDTPPSDGKTPDTPPSGGKTPETPPSGGKTPETPPSDGKTPETPPSDGKTPNAPPSGGKTPETPPSNGKTPDTPSGGKVVTINTSDIGTPTAGKPPVDTTILPDVTITPTPIFPSKNDDSKDKHKHITRFTTYITSFYSVIPGSTKLITTTNEAGEPTTLATYVPPSTVLVVQQVVSPISESEDTDGSGNMLNVQGLWGIGMSITVVCFSMFYMVLA